MELSLISAYILTNFIWFSIKLLQKISLNKSTEVFNVSVFNMVLKLGCAISDFNLFPSFGNLDSSYAN